MILYDVRTRRCLNGAVSELTSVLVNSKLVLAGPVDPLLSWEKMHLGYLGWDRIEHLPGQPQKWIQHDKYHTTPSSRKSLVTNPSVTVPLTHQRGTKTQLPTNLLAGTRLTVDNAVSCAALRWQSRGCTALLKIATAPVPLIRGPRESVSHPYCSSGHIMSMNNHYENLLNMCKCMQAHASAPHDPHAYCWQISLRDV